MTPVFTFDLEKFDFTAVHEWLASTYWSPGISPEKVEKGFRASTLCIGAFDGGRQVGMARCVSDTTRFAYLADVYVDITARKQGLAKEMVRRLMEHPLVADVDAWYLRTLDAHAVYAALDYEPIQNPESFMVRRRPAVPSAAPLRGSGG